MVAALTTLYDMTTLCAKKDVDVHMRHRCEQLKGQGMGTGTVNLIYNYLLDIGRQTYCSRFDDAKNSAPVS